MADFIRRALLFLSVATMTESYGQLFHVVGVPFTLNKTVTAVLLSFVFFSIVLDAYRLPRNPKNPFFLVFAVSVVAGLVLGAFQGTPNSTVLALSLTFSSVLLFYFLISYVVRNRRDVAVLAWGFVLGSIAVALTGLLGVGNVEDTQFGARVGGFGGSSNLLGYNLLPAIPFCAMLYLERRGLVRRTVLAGGALVIVTAILLTLSRSAFVSLAAMGAFWVLTLGRMSLRRYLVPALVLAAVAITIVPQGLIDRMARVDEEIEQIFVPTGQDVTQRNLANYWAVFAFFTNPVTGRGFGQFANWGHEQDPRLDSHRGIHNSYLQVLAHQGLLGFIPYAAILAITWRELTRVRRLGRTSAGREDPELWLLSQRAAFLQMGFLACLVANLFGPYITNKPAWLFSGLATYALVEAKRQLARRSAEPRPAEDARARDYPWLAPGLRTGPGLWTPREGHR